MLYKNEEIAIKKDETKIGKDANVNSSFEKSPQIRLIYFAINQCNDCAGNVKINQSFGMSSPFASPKGMNIEDTCKIVSYLSEKVEKTYNLEPASLKSVQMVSGLLEKYGFVKIGGYWHGVLHGTVFNYNEAVKLSAPIKRVYNYTKDDNYVDLFSVGGDFDLFKNTPLYHRYFNWFVKNVSEEDIKNIYNNLNISFNENKSNINQTL